MITGNHDILSNNNTSSHSLKPFKYYKNTTVLDYMTEIGELVFIPYSHEAYKVRDFLNTVKDKLNKTVITHLDFAGARYNDFLCSNSGIDVNWFKSFQKVLAHHYHLPQQLGNNILFPGSPQRFSFREPKNDLTRGLILCNTNSNTYQRININPPEWITLTDNNIEIIKNISRDNYLKILCSCDNVLDLNGIKDVELENFKGLEIVYEVERITMNNLRREKEDLVVESEDKILKEYINSYTDLTKEFKDELFNKGMEILKKVKE